MTRADYHIHLERYGLTRDALLHLIDSARNAGVSEIGITEHAYHFAECREIYPTDNRWFHAAGGPDYFEWRMDDYVRLLESAREEGLPVKAAIEWDYIPGREEALERLILGYPWDFSLGSVHWLRDRSGGWWGFDIPEQAGEWGRSDIDEVYAQYFHLLCDAARAGIFDILAHPDLIKVFGYRPATDVTPHYERLAETMASSGGCAEVSTAGWRKPVGEQYPSEDLLTTLCRSGIPIVISSDAHEAEEIGYGFDRAEALVRGAGYNSRCIFSRRRREEIPLHPL